MAEEVTLRPLAAVDDGLLVEATLGNLNWSGPRFTLQDVLDRPEFRHYTRLAPDRGDFGVVAEHEGRPVGVGWAQLLPAEDPGYGFVDGTTPEVSLWVGGDLPGSRGGSAPAAPAPGRGRPASDHPAQPLGRGRQLRPAALRGRGVRPGERSRAGRRHALDGTGRRAQPVST